MANGNFSNDGPANFSITQALEVNYYNTTTHQQRSLDQMVAEGWVSLPESYGPQYQYPALYNPSTHAVIDMSAGSSADSWIVTSSNEVLSVTEDSADPDGTGTLSYSWETSADGNTWSEIATTSTYTLTSSDYGNSFRAIISYTDNDGFSESITTSTKQIAAVDDGDASFSITEKVTATYYNTSTHQVQTLDQMLAAGWLELSEATYGNTYQYPAIYSNGVISDENGPIRQALDMSAGDQVGDWIVASSGNGITITEDSADPDGTGTLSYSWESSDDGNTGWTEIYTSANYTITSADEGKHVRAVITYTDDEGFSETVTTNSTQVFFDDGDAAFSINETVEVNYYNTTTHQQRSLDQMVAEGWVSLPESYGPQYQYPALYNPSTHAVIDMSAGSSADSWIVTSSNEVLSVTEDSADPDGTGTLSYSWETSADGNTWSEIATTSTYTLTSSDYGNSFRAIISYTDNDGFSESITTSTKQIAAVDDGDASFSITEKVTATYYNTSTHQVQTLDQMLAAGWLELSEASYGNTYQYPAIYSNGVISDENGPIRQALDMSAGDQVGDWIVASSGNGITITEDSADPDGTGTLSYSWESSDDGNTGWTEIYTSANYTITSADEGKHVRAVITYTDDEGFSETVTTNSTQVFFDDGDAAFSINETVEVNYYNTTTHQQRSLDQMVAEGWVSLPESYGPQYQYPALYNPSTHAVIDMSAGSSADSWIVTSSNEVLSVTEDSADPDGTGTLSYSWETSADGNTWSEIATTSTYTLTSSDYGNSFRAIISYTDNDGFSESITTSTKQIAAVDDGDASFSITEKVTATYYNTSTHQVQTLDQMLAAGWLELSEATYGNTYQYPAIYSNGVISDENGPIRQALDMSAGDQVGDWIVASSGNGITITEDSADPDGTGTLSYSWESSDDGNTGWTEIYTSANYTITSADEGKHVRAVITYTDDEGFSETVTTNSTQVFFDDGDAAFSINETVEVNYYNTTTHQQRSLDQMVAEGWVSLPESYGPQYQYPALYNPSTHAVIDMSAGSSADSWIVTSSNEVLSVTEDSADPDGTGTLSYSWETSADGNTWSEIATTSTYTLTSSDYGNSFRAIISYTDNDGFSESITTSTKQIAAVDDGDASFSITEKVTATYYNTSTHQVQTLDQMLAAGWLELSEASYGNTYQYPAIYSNGVISDENGPIRQALDMSAGDQVGDWIVASSGNGITITEDSADPDGTGTLSYSWESSDDGNTGWTEIYTSANYTITSADEGKHVRAVITYTDDEGFSETVTTNSMQIPKDDGDASFSITGTASRGNTLSISTDSADPDGNGTLSYSWQTSSNGVNWQSKSTDSSYTVAYDDAGKYIQAVLAYTDGEGFTESVATSSITISSDLIFRGTWGVDTLNGGALADKLYGYAGDDIINGFAGDDKAYGGSGGDIINGQNGDDRLVGHQGHDILKGGHGDDWLHGGTGKDRLIGHSGDDTLIGGTGNDNLFGGTGNDNLYGNAGNDRLDGQLGDDTLRGGGGVDVITGNDGNDTLYGDSGNDILRGGNDLDTLFGGVGNDRLFGQSGDDILYGGEGNDTLFGDAGNDTLFGGLGVDSIYGGDGDDIINGGFGNDLLWGGNGSDTFQLNDDIDRVIIKDFVIGEDSLEVMSGSLGVYVEQFGNDTKVYREDDYLAIINNVFANDLTINGNLIA